MAKLETKKMLAAAVAAAEDKQALDLRILELDAAESGLTDYFLVMSGANARQMQTLADEIELQLKRQFGQYANSREGYRQAEWILLDYVDFVVHIFSQEKRGYYDIERLRKSATAVTPEELREALTAKTAKSREQAAGADSASKTAAGKQAAGKKTAGTRKVVGIPLGAKKTGAKGLAKKSAKAVAGKRAAGQKPVGRKKATGSAPEEMVKAAGKAKGGGTVKAAGKAKAAGKTKASRPVVRGKNKLKPTPKSTPKSRKRS